MNMEIPIPTIIRIRVLVPGDNELETSSFVVELFVESKGDLSETVPSSSLIKVMIL
jgi:hypothetical protein